MLIKNANLITYQKPHSVLINQYLIIDGDKIQKIGNMSELIIDRVHDHVIDAHGQFILPGNICAHTHFYGAYSKGLAIPGEAPSCFPEILEKLWWRLDKSLDLDDVYYCAMVCLIDAVRHGTTTLFDHHASPNSISGSLHRIAQAVKEVGIRAALCYEVTDRDGDENMRAGIKENLEFFRNNNHLNTLISSMFGLHASLTLSEKTLEIVRNEAPNDIGFHIHAAEHSIDEYDSIKKSGKRVIERLNEFGILGPKTIVAHAVHIDFNEASLLKDTKTWVSHQPRSNMNNAVGMSQVESLMDSGVKVCIGNDGFSNAMWDEWRTCYLAHKLWNLDPRRMSATSIIEMAVINNAELVKSQFNDLDVGVIKEGAQADLIIVNYHPVTPITTDNFPWHIIFGFRDGMVETTIVNGKLIMYERELVNIDEEKILAEAEKSAQRVWKRFNSLC